MPFDRNNQPDTTAFFETHGLKLIGKGPWRTTACTFHGGRETMRVNLASGGWVCMSCGEKGGDVLAYQIAVTGADFVTAAKAIGAWIDDGKPCRQQKPTPLSPRAALSAMTFEATLTAVAAGNIAKGVLLTEADRSRLMKAASRISRMVEVFE